MKKPTRPLRILHLSNSASSLGNGIVNVAVDLAIDQASRGMAVAFLSAGGGWTELMEERGVRIYTLPLNGGRELPKVLRSFWKIVREFKPDVVHAHMRKGLFLVWPIARLLGIPVVLHLHNIHNKHMGTTRLADRVIAVSHAVADDLKRDGTPARRIRVVMNGTLGTQRLPANPPPLLLGRPAIVSVAGITIRKGMYELIEAFNSVSDRYPTANLYLVGGGHGETAEIEAFASKLPSAERIHFEDFQDDPRRYMSASDVFVLASRREAFGLALIEARAAGCAIVATNVDGIPEIVEHQKTGLLVAPESPVALAEAMTSILDDADLSKTLRKNAVQGLEIYAVERMSQAVEAVYGELLLKKGKS